MKMRKGGIIVVESTRLQWSIALLATIVQTRLC